MKKFEYETLENPTRLKDAVLNILGTNGLELVSVLRDEETKDWVYFFKREITESI